MRNALKKLVIFVIVSVVAGYTIIGFFQISQEVDTSLIFKKISNNQLLAKIDCNSYFKNLYSAKKAPRNRPAQTKKNKFTGINLRLLFYMFGICIAFHNKKLIHILVLNSIMLWRDKAFGRIDLYLKLPYIALYKSKVLKFLSPIQKCIEARADEYDIEPVLNSRFCVKSTPYFVKSEQNTGCFLFNNYSLATQY
jgi:hypothetical protein